MRPHPKADTTTYRLFVERLGGSPVEEFVGEFGEVFYDPLTGNLRLSDGETAGGISISSGSNISDPPGPGGEIPPGAAGDIVAVPNADGRYFLYVYDGTDWQETYLTNEQVLAGDESPFALGQLRQITLPDGTTLDNQQDINVYFATTVHQLKEDFETKIEEIDDRLDVLETDPITKEYVDTQDTTLSDRLDVLEGDPTTKTYVDDELSKLEAAVDAASGGLIFIDNFSVDKPLPDPSTLERGNFFICSSDTPYQDPQLTEIANEGDKAIVDDTLGYVLINEVDTDTLYLSKTGDDTTTGKITAAGLKSPSLDADNELLLTVNRSVKITVGPNDTKLETLRLTELRPYNKDTPSPVNVYTDLKFNDGSKVFVGDTQQLTLQTESVSYLGEITSGKHIVTREYLESQAYELPVATTSTLGGIKIGAEFGLNNDDQLTLNPTTFATTSDLGFVKVGSGLDVTNDGTLSVMTDGGLDSRYLKKTGDTMTGTLTLSGDPVNNQDAATKSYVDANQDQVLSELSDYQAEAAQEQAAQDQALQNEIDARVQRDTLHDAEINTLEYKLDALLGLTFRGTYEFKHEADCDADYLTCMNAAGSDINAQQACTRDYTSCEQDKVRPGYFEAVDPDDQFDHLEQIVISKNDASGVEVDWAVVLNAGDYLEVDHVFAGSLDKTNYGLYRITEEPTENTNAYGEAVYTMKLQFLQGDGVMNEGEKYEIRGITSAEGVNPEELGDFLTKDQAAATYLPLSGGTLTGTLNMKDAAAVKTRHLDSGENSNLELKHNGVSKVYVGADKTSFQEHIKMATGKQVYSGTEKNGLAFYNNGVQYVGEYTVDKHVATKKNVDAAIYNDPSDPNSNKYVDRSGDTMTGNLRIDRSDEAASIETILTIIGKRPDTANSAATIQFKNADNSGSPGYLTYRSYDTKSYFAFNRNVYLNNQMMYGVGHLKMKAGTYIYSDDNPRILVRNPSQDSAATQIQRPGDGLRTFSIRGKDAGSNTVKDIFWAYGNSGTTGDAINYTGLVTQNNHIVNKKWVDDNKAAKSHSHSGYASSSHNHNSSYVKGNYTITKSNGNYYIS